MPENNNSQQGSPKFSAKAIRKAIQTLGPILGHSAIDAMIYDFENQGLALINDHEEYSIAQVQTALENIFGVETSVLLIRHIAKELFKHS